MMRLNMPQLIAAHQQLERRHLPTSFPPPTHSSRGRERGARCVWRVSTVHPHTQRETGSRARVAGEARGDSAVRKSRYLCHRVNLRSHFRPAFDPQINQASGGVASHNPRSGVWLFSHPRKHCAETARARGAAAACAAAAWVQYRDAPPASPAAARGAHRGTRARIIYVLNMV